PRGYTVIRKPLNLRQRHGILMQGEGSGSIISADFPDIADARKWPVVDMTGASFCTLRDFAIGAPSVKTKGAGCGLLLARHDFESAGNHLVDNLVIEGWYGCAAILCAASECNQINHCFLQTMNGDGQALFVGNGPAQGEAPGPYAAVKCHV